MNRKKLYLFLLLPLSLVCFDVSLGVAQSARVKPKQLYMLQSQLEAIETGKEATSIRLKALRDDLEVANAALDKIQISDVAYDEVMKMLQIQRIELLIDIAGLEARQSELAKSNRKQIEIKLIENRIEVAQQKAIAVKEEYEISKKLHEKKFKTDLELNRASLQVTLAERELRQVVLELDQARNKSEDSETTIELVEKNARLKKVNAILNEQVQTRSTIGKINQLKNRISSENVQMKKWNEQIAILRTRIAELQAK